MTFRWSDSPQSLARQFAWAAAALAGISVLLIALASWWWIDRLQNDSVKVIQRQEVELRATRVAETLSRVEERARELAEHEGEAHSRTGGVALRRHALAPPSGARDEEERGLDAHMPAV